MHVELFPQQQTTYSLNRSLAQCYALLRCCFCCIYFAQAVCAAFPSFVVCISRSHTPRLSPSLVRVQYMVTIVSGAAGNHEKDGASVKSPSVTCSENYGWGYFTAVNATHATWSYHTVLPDGPGPAAYTDSLTIIKS